MLCEIFDSLSDAAAKLEAAQKSKPRECPNLRAVLTQINAARHVLKPLADAESAAAAGVPVVKGPLEDVLPFDLIVSKRPAAHDPIDLQAVPAPASGIDAYDAAVPAPPGAEEPSAEEI